MSVFDDSRVGGVRTGSPALRAHQPPAAGPGAGACPVLWLGLLVSLALWWLDIRAVR